MFTYVSCCNSINKYRRRFYPLCVENEASREDGNVFVIIVLCIIFCFAIRHINDFYNGETVTLVEEGVCSRRFRHKVEYRFPSNMESDVDEMYGQLKEKEEQRIKMESTDKL